LRSLSSFRASESRHRRSTLWSGGCRLVSFATVIHPTQWSRIAA
jgi:hypothetical protein